MAASKIHQNGKPKKTRKKSVETKAKKLSALAAAAQVLAETGLACKEMIEAMATKGYWSSPAARRPLPLFIPGFSRRSPPRGRNPAFRRPTAAASPGPNVVITRAAVSPGSCHPGGSRFPGTVRPKEFSPWLHVPLGKAACRSASSAFPASTMWKASDRPIWARAAGRASMGRFSPCQMFRQLAMTLPITYSLRLFIVASFSGPVLLLLLYCYCALLPPKKKRRKSRGRSKCL